MRATTENKRNRSVTAGAALWVLGLCVATMVLMPAAALAVVEATLTQTCETNYTVTAKIVDNQDTVDLSDDTPVSDYEVSFYTDKGNFWTQNAIRTGADGTAVWSFDGVAGEDYVATAFGGFGFVSADVMHNQCLDISQSNPSNNSVPVYGRSKLNVNRHGYLTLKICGTEEFDVDRVDLGSVSLEGVSPRYHKRRDLKGCPGGKDGYKDVKFKFKKHAIVKALMKKVNRRLEHGEVMELEFAGTYNGHSDLTTLDGKLQEGTPLDGTYKVEIVNKCKKKKHWRKWWRNHKKKCAKYDRDD